MKILPTFQYESAQWKRGKLTVAGLDEVGRGAFAGPVVTAAVIFKPHYKFKNDHLNAIDDSKRLSAKRRAELAEIIKEEALCFSISEIPLSIINEQGIGQAAQTSFLASYKALCHPSDFLLVDGFLIKNIHKDLQLPIIHGDRLSISIAAASILAKVFRDQRMDELHSIHPEYGFAENKGYGTAYHRKQIRDYDLSPAHRTSFKLGRYSKAAA